MRARLLVPLLLALSTSTCTEGTSPEEAQDLVNFLLDFCSEDIPAFLAVQNSSGGAWTPVTGDANGTFTLSVAPKFGVAVVYEVGQFFEAEVVYATPDDVAFLDGLTCAEPPALNRSIAGSVPGLTGSQQALVSIHEGATALIAGGPSTFQIDFLPSQPLDVVASRITGSTVDRMIVRRNVGASATSISALDFADAEAITPANNALAFSGLGNDAIGLERYFHSSLGTTHPLVATQTSATTASFMSVPSAQTLAGDMQELALSATDFGIAGVRVVRTFFRAGSDLTSALGADLNTPTVTFSGTPPRPRVQLTRQQDYGLNVLALFSEGTKAVGLTKTERYAGSASALWDVQFPDLSAVSGFPGGGLTSGSGADWFISATNAPLSFLFTNEPTEGLVVKAASRFSTGSTMAFGNKPGARLPGSRMRGGRRG